MSSLKEFLFQPIKWETHNPSVLLEGVVSTLDRAMTKTGKGLKKIYENNVLDGVLELYPLRIEVSEEEVPREKRVERKGKKLIYRVNDRKLLDKHGQEGFNTKLHPMK
ncbi:hypothetical protein COV19_01855 [Candidatus Woesearchaeota archaeon CG10_big_fil_rev_8_21_14_0_10_44_13]|nr:MAG: hypothetical protein COV19_01855 [Candidatus Woesearchaeota archaeon CG10_big_fil_rev_8_21_14_0_10_44_13]